MSEYVDIKHTEFSEGSYFAQGGFNLPKFRIFVPKGTKGWVVSFQSYAVPEEARFDMRMDSPAVDAINISDTRFTLEELDSGKSVYTYGPPGSGGMSVSTYQQSDFRTSQDSYIYIDAKYPGGSLIRFESRLVYDVVAPEPEPTEEAQLLVLMNSVGLTQALYTLSKEQSDQEFIDAAIQTGTWESLLNLYRKLK